MEKTKAIKKILKRLHEIKDNDKIVFYNNPDDFKRFRLERVNPNHIGYIYGFHKNKKNWVRMAKVYFANIVFAFKTQLDGLISILTTNMRFMLSNIDIVSFCFCLWFSLIFVILILNMPGYIVPMVLKWKI